MEQITMDPILEHLKAVMAAELKAMTGESSKGGGQDGSLA
jgi:hypothetical protein